jgi:ABC-type sugar transport system ATPase subunit
MADRIAVMNEGRLQQVSDSEDLYLRPRNLFVAGFIGSPPMNFMDATFLPEEGILDFADFTLRLPDEIAELVRKNVTSEKVILGIRPEHLRPYKEGDLMTLKAEVYATEPLGRDLIVNFKVGRWLIKMITKPPFKAAIGEEMLIGFDIDKMHIFDKRTEETLI